MESGRDPQSKSAGPAPGADEAARRRGMLRWGVVGLAVLVALIAWLATRNDDYSDSTSRVAAPPRIVTPAELATVEAELGQPIYWAGPVKGAELELKDLGGAGVQVLYLPEGTPVGQGSVKTLTIGSYPLDNPEKALEGFAEREGSVSRTAGDGTEVVVSKTSPTSVYFTGGDNEVQVEVYQPSAAKAMALALSGKVKPAG